MSDAVAKAGSLKRTAKAFTNTADMQERIQIAADFFILKEKFYMNLKKIEQLKADS